MGNSLIPRYKALDGIKKRPIGTTALGIVTLAFGRPKNETDEYDSMIRLQETFGNNFPQLFFREWPNANVTISSGVASIGFF